MRLHHGLLSLVVMCFVSASARSQSGTQPATAPDATELLRSASVGAVLTLPASMGELQSIPRIPITRTLTPDAPQLVFSDAPEYFRTDSIALRETVKAGRVRLYLYHVPLCGTEKKTITAAIENLGDAPMTLRFLRYAFPKPGVGYQRIGKAGLVTYFNSKPQPAGEARKIAPGACAAVDPELDRTVVKHNDLVHLIYEFEIDQPARITVLQRRPEQKTADVVRTLPVVASRRDGGAGRGLFLTSDFDVTSRDGFVLDPSAGPAQLVIADGKSEPWITGRDAIDGQESADRGNYGVMYHVRLKYRGAAAGPRRGWLALMTNGYQSYPACSHLSAAMSVEGRTIALPADKDSFVGWPSAAVVARLAPLEPGEVKEFAFTYSPPGASCLPTPIVFLPVP